MKTTIVSNAGLNTAIGKQDLCAWQPTRGVVWVQTRDPRQARRLGQRSDGRLVARGVAGGYLKTFEFRRSLAWAARSMKRYMGDGMATNDGLNRAVFPGGSRTSRKRAGQGVGSPSVRGDVK